MVARITNIDLEDNYPNRRIIIESANILRIEQNGQIEVFGCSSLESLQNKLKFEFGENQPLSCILANNCIDPEHTNIWLKGAQRGQHKLFIVPPNVDPYSVNWTSCEDRRERS